MLIRLRAASHGGFMMLCRTWILFDHFGSVSCVIDVHALLLPGQWVVAPREGMACVMKHPRLG
jgi:hypothetical protein